MVYVRVIGQGVYESRPSYGTGVYRASLSELAFVLIEYVEVLDSKECTFQAWLHTSPQRHIRTDRHLWTRVASLPWCSSSRCTLRPQLICPRSERLEQASQSRRTDQRETLPDRSKLLMRSSKQREGLFVRVNEVVRPDLWYMESTVTALNLLGNGPSAEEESLQSPSPREPQGLPFQDRLSPTR